MNTKNPIWRTEEILTQSVPKDFDELLQTSDWPGCEAPSCDEELVRLIRSVHFFNTSLWNEEDLARRTKVSDSEIAKNKRAIDHFNQARNDYIEEIDDLIIGSLSSIPLGTDAHRSSETPGSMIDRISILSLKIFHTGKQLQRIDIDDAHRATCGDRLRVLTEQRTDLTKSLGTLVKGIQTGAMYFKVYRQYKMYNDPKFNPALVAENSISRIPKG
jgi:hypothetical protein